ncbi:MAG: hypothetical protein MZW92_40520 [Comamonadaceae bacterium]|nr:hypothetical protein [Comamonadaceae bacterium]
MLERLKATYIVAGHSVVASKEVTAQVRQPGLPDRHGHARRGLRRPGQRARDPGRPLHGTPGRHDAQEPGPSGEARKSAALVQVSPFPRPPAGGRIMMASARRAPWRLSWRTCHGTQPAPPVRSWTWRRTWT